LKTDGEAFGKELLASSEGIEELKLAQPWFAAPASIFERNWNRVETKLAADPARL
jgi:hypothetical protein